MFGFGAQERESESKTCQKVKHRSDQAKEPKARWSDAWGLRLWT